MRETADQAEQDRRRCIEMLGGKVERKFVYELAFGLGYFRIVGWEVERETGSCYIVSKFHRLQSVHEKARKRRRISKALVFDTLEEALTVMQKAVGEIQADQDDEIAKWQRTLENDKKRRLEMDE